MKEGKIQPDLVSANQPRTLFKPGSWLAKIDFINHLILFNNVLITVLSEKEGGKTSFSTLLQNNLDQQIKSISMTIKPPCDREAIIDEIATQLHLVNDSQTDFTSIVAQINERKAHVLLIIDNAQHLPESLIKETMLAIKNQDEFGFFHVCLVSDYSIVATLNNLAVDQFNNLIHTIELGSLNENETRTYVLQRAMATHLINRPLTDAQYKQFYQQTKGNLAKINSSLEAFVHGCSVQQKKNKAFTLKRTSLAVITALAIGGSYLYFEKIENKNPAISDLFSIASLLNKENGAEKIPVKSENSEQLASHIASWQDSSTRQFVHYALPKKQILDGIDEEENTVNTVALVDKVVVIPTVNVKTINSPAQLPVTEPVLESKLVSYKTNTIEPGVKKSVIKLGTGRYTIQLVASHNVNDVYLFRKNHNLIGKTKIRHFTNAKGTWYILTLGEYQSRNVAQMDTRKLPAPLTKLSPWVRPVSGLSNLG